MNIYELIALKMQGEALFPRSPYLAAQWVKARLCLVRMQADRPRCVIGEGPLYNPFTPRTLAEAEARR